MDRPVDLLSRHPFLSGVPSAQLDRLATVSYGAVLRPGSRLFDEGGHADHCWLILDGSVRLDTHVPGRGDLTVETLGPGSVLGWSWLFPPYRWHFAATTTAPTHCVVLSGPGVRQLCEQDPVLGFDLIRRFLQVVVDRLQHTRIRLLDAYAAPASKEPTGG
ncbi:MAG: cyclic nucleotide-binding domain-containing protein [Hamadaea sp.]|nr:cyclic nucleotide-binding domain-containing protein [Hamadaea sp.]